MWERKQVYKQPPLLNLEPPPPPAPRKGPATILCIWRMAMANAQLREYGSAAPERPKRPEVLKKERK